MEEGSVSESPTVWLINHYGGLPGEVRSERSWRTARSFAACGFRTFCFSASFHHIQLESVAEERVGRAFVTEDGYRHVAVKTRPYRGNGPSRLFNMIDLHRGLCHQLDEGRIPAPDLVVASSPHPFTYLFAGRARRRTGCRVILEERDIWPLSLVELADTPRWHPIVFLFARMARRAYRKCDALVSLLPNAEPYFRSQGLGAGKFHYIPNGVGDSGSKEASVPLPDVLSKSVESARDEGKLVVVYTGAMGPPNALDQLFALAEIGEAAKPYRILCIGEGVQRESLTLRAEREGLEWLEFHPPVPRSVVRRLVDEADAGFISLRPSSVFEYGVSPNKLFEYMAAGKPVVFSVNSSNNPVKEAGGGYTVTPCDAAELDGALSRLAGMTPPERASLGEKGKAWVDAHHHWNELGDRYAALCREVLAGKRENGGGGYPGKRLFDGVGALAGLLVLAPVICALAVLVRFKLGSLVFFRQERPGRDGELFQLVKFRSMSDETDEKGEPLPDEERLGKFGAWLRRTSLDELPELWNVLCGDMSLVGPRPLLAEYLPLYDKRQARRHEVRPGLTGWAQVNGRNATSWEDRLEMDVWYVENESLWLDVKILWMTLQTVLRKEGIEAKGHATMPRFRGSQDSMSANQDE